MNKEKKKYLEHLKLESSQKVIIPANTSDKKREELELLNKDPFSHFLKYVQPFMSEEEKADSKKTTIFDFLCNEEE